MRFSLERKLPSCAVDKRTVLELENYIIEQGRNVFGLSPELSSERFSVTIEESVGTANLSSISQFNGEKFPDTTKAIRLHLAPWSSNSCDLDVCLHRDSFLSRLKAESEGPQSRERTVGFMDGVLRILEPRRSSAWLFHPHPAIGGGIFTLTLASIGAVLGTIRASAVFQVPCLLLVLCLGIFHVGAFLNPYTAFSSRQVETQQKWWQWFVMGSAAFILFGTLLVVFRKRLIGF